MQYLRADTITEVTIGPAVAVGDGFTPVTNLGAVSPDEFEIIKHGATTTTAIAGTLAAITGADGYYALDLSATDTNTEGRLTLLINDDSLILPIRMEFMVVNANVFDSLFAAATTDYLQVDTLQLAGTTQDATDLADFAAAGYDPGTNKVQGVVLVDTITTYTGNTVQTGNVATLITTVGTAGDGLTAINLPNQTMDITGNITGNLSGSVGSVAGNVDGNVTGSVGSMVGTITTLDALDTAQDTQHTTTQGRLPAALVGGLMSSDVTAISTSTTAADNLESSALGIVPGACEGTPSTTVIQTDLAETTDDQYIGRIVVFTSGAAAGEATDITDYTGSTGTITVTALVNVPAVGNTFVIV